MSNVTKIAQELGLFSVKEEYHPAYGQFILAEKGDCILSVTVDGEVLFYVKETTFDIGYKISVKDILYCRKKFLQFLPYLKGKLWCHAEDRDTLFERRKEYFVNLGFVYDPYLAKYKI